MGWEICDSSTRNGVAMKIAVTGASGFIGRHLLPVLIVAGHDVIAVVRDKETINDLDVNCVIVEHEISNENNDVFEKLGKPDVLLHLAWGGLANYYSLHHIDTELPTYYDFIRSMVESGVKHVAVIGTCFEYGMQSGMLSEELDTKPSNPYGYAKDALRKQLQFLQKEFDFSLAWMRLFYMHGEDQPGNTLYSQLRSAVQRGNSTFNMSGGEQLRDYLYIDQVVHHIAKIVLKNEDIGVVNVCSGKPVSVRRLVESWKEENGWCIDLNLGHYPYPDYEPFAFWGSDKKMNMLLK